MTTNLTAPGVKALKPRTTGAYYVSDGLIKGLQIRVGQDGAKSWSVRYRVGKRQRRLTLGSAAVLPLGDDRTTKQKGARTLAREALHQLKNGIDPAVSKRAGVEADTVADLASTYIEKYAKPKKRSWKNDQRILDTEILPQWKRRAAKEITRRDVRELIENIAKRGPILANRVRALLHKMFVFAMQRDIVETNPVAGTERPGVENARSNFLTDDEIRRFWTASEALSVEMRAFWRLRLLTGQRGGEVGKMRWADVDLDAGLWTIPATDAKNKKEHLVPLSPPAIDILTALRTKVDQIIEARQVRGDTRPKPILYVLRGARGNRQRSSAAATFGLDDFRGHDLRRTAATNMRKAGVPSSDISRVLNHVEGGPAATRVYDRYDGLSEKRIALNTWASTLTSILAGKDGASVLAFAASA
jgi:integrase